MRRKYATAVKMYAETEMKMKDIAKQCGLSRGALGQYLRRHQRELVLRRYNIDSNGRDPNKIKLIGAGKAGLLAHEKYKQAVEACDSEKYIQLNVSQVARLFSISGVALLNYMRVHYNDVLERREQVRQQLGLSDNTQRGMRKQAREQYAKAVEMYKTTDMTLPEVAERCMVSERGLSQHLRFYHKDVMRLKEEQRKQALTTTEKERGDILGNGRKNQPLPQIEKKYIKALYLYRSTTMTMKDIAERTGVTKEGLRFYLNKWHKPLVLERAHMRKVRNNANSKVMPRDDEPKCK